MNSSPSGPSLSSFFTIERVVALLTPTVFAPAATWIAALIAANVPFVPAPSTGTIEGIEIAAFLGACLVAIKWLHGRQIPAIAGVTPPISLSDAERLKLIAEIEDYLATHRETFQGPQGAPGAVASPETLAQEAEAAVRRVLAGAAQGATPVV